MIISQIWSVLHEFRLVRWLCASFNSPRLYSIVTGRTQKQTPWHSSEHSSAKSKACDIGGAIWSRGFSCIFLRNEKLKKHQNPQNHKVVKDLGFEIIIPGTPGTYI